MKIMYVKMLSVAMAVVALSACSSTSSHKAHQPTTFGAERPMAYDHHAHSHQTSHQASHQAGYHHANHHYHQDDHAINHRAVGQAMYVADLSALADESPVRLTGKITKALRDDEYLFSDGTGQVVVEIDHELWRGRAVSGKDTITIVGELDVEYRPTKRLKVDVDYVEF